LSTCKLGSHKSPQQWQNQLVQRGWTLELIDEAIASGRRYPAPNYVNHGNTATRYVSPRTGQSVVIDDQTGEVLYQPDQSPTHSGQGYERRRNHISVSVNSG
jgi:hypothetical protein